VHWEDFALKTWDGNQSPYTAAHIADSGDRFRPFLQPLADLSRVPLEGVEHERGNGTVCNLDESIEPEHQVLSQFGAYRLEWDVYVATLASE